ncbi:MAG: SDR family oxidoreductase [Acetobacteraceae bacterium]|nr:SDR family oxidoreductase [Acetobacteraceae bacterium]
MDLHLTGKRALITGGSRGIGRASAETLAEEGCDVVLVARDPAALEEAASAIRAKRQVRAEVIAADLSRQEEVERVAEAAGTIDILVNNAGAIPPGNLLAVDDAMLRAAWDLKVFGFISLARALYPALRERGGVIVNVIGAAGETFDPGYIAGVAGNAALMAFTRALGRGGHKDGIRAVAVNPGPVATQRMERLLRHRADTELGEAGRWRELCAGMPYGRPAEPAEIGAAVAFLASPRSAYTNGTVLTINGGP